MSGREIPRLQVWLRVFVTICGSVIVGAEIGTSGVFAQGYPESLPAPPPNSPGAFTPGTPMPAGPPQVVADVVIKGNRNTPLTKVQANLKTRRGREFDPEQVQADVRRLMKDGHFRDVRTFTQPTPDGVVVIFEVFERPTIEEIVFVGNRGIKDSVLLKQSDLKKGEALNQYSVEEARRKVEEFYHTKGYPKTSVSILEGNQPQDHRVVFLINEGQLQRIWAVDFVGNEIASDSRLKTQIESKPGYLKYLFKGKVDRKKIDEDVERLTAYYRSLGYFRARVSRELEFNANRDWLTLRFVIDEGPRYVIRNVTVAGNDKYTTDSLLGQIELKSGEFFNQAKMNRDIGTLKDAYGSEGFIFADIQADPRFLEEPGQLDLIYKIKEGEPFRVGKIEVKIEGDYPRTRHSTVMNRMSLRPGDLIDIREVRNSESRLKAAQLFEVDRSKGNPPQVVVRPPDLKNPESIADKPKPRAGSNTYRGQSPAQPPRN